LAKRINVLKRRKNMTTGKTITTKAFKDRLIE
jgi:hypothetical protein